MNKPLLSASYPAMKLRSPAAPNRPATTRARVAIAVATLATLALVGCAEAAPPDAQYPQAPAPLTEQAGQPMPLQDEPVAPGVDSTMQGAPVASGAEAGQDVAIGVDNEEYADADPSALTEFRPALDPYGTWADDPTYGSVWTPSPTVVGADFAPYVTAGRWTYNNEYVWVSDYDWGWAPFHYGRWVYISGRGWSWIPGRRYSGAWVVWRTGDPGYGYVGWAAAPPLWYWRGGYAYGVYNVPPAPYAFCPTGRVFEPAVHRHIVTGAEVAVIGAHTRAYVPASPTVNAGVGVRAAMATRVSNGPPLRDLGVANGVAPVPPPSDRGLQRAREVATPRIVQGPATTVRPIDPRLLGATRNPRIGDPRDPPSRLPDLNPTRPAPMPMTQPMPRGPMPAAPAPVFRPTPMPQSVARPMPSPAPVARPMPQMSAPVMRPQMSAPVMRPQVSAPVMRPAPQVRIAPAPQMSRPLVSPRAASPHVGGRR